MSRIRVVLAIVNAPLPVGSVYDHTTISVRDSNGVLTEQVLNGQESPPWTADFEVSDGPGLATAVAVDFEGQAIGDGASVEYDTTVAPVQTFPAPSALSVTKLA